MATELEEQVVEKGPAELTQRITVTKDEETAIRKLVSVSFAVHFNQRGGEADMHHSVRSTPCPDRLHALRPFISRPWEHWTGKVSRR